MRKLHYLNATVICIGFTAYMFSDRILLNNGKIMFVGDNYIHYMDGIRLKRRPMAKLDDINIIDTNPDLKSEAIQTFKDISNDYPYVIFSNHTCVLLKDDSKGIEKEQLLSNANEIMQKYGKVYPGTASTDMGLIKLDNDDGYLITCDNPDMLTFVSHKHEMQSKSANNMDIDVCFYGIRKRDEDSKSLKPIYWSNTITNETL